MEPGLKPNADRKYAKVLRPLTQRERDGLRSQLKADGLLLHALICDQHGDLLDGHSREELCNELGIALRYKTVTTDNPVRWIENNQTARRNLTEAEMRKLIVKTKIANPETSMRTIAGQLGVSLGHVSKTLSKAGVSTETPVKGRDGKTYNPHSNVVSLKPGVPHKAQEEADRKADFHARYEANKARQMAEAQERWRNDPVVQAATKAPEKPAPMSAEERLAKYGPPPVLEMKNGRLSGFTESLVYHFADTGEFHSVPKMIAVLDPDNRFKLTTATFYKQAYRFEKERKNIYLETRPGIGRQKQYKFYRQDKTIGLSVLRAKFGPVIEDLKAYAAKPISHQSSQRFNEAAGMLIQLLRDLEAE